MKIGKVEDKVVDERGSIVQVVSGEWRQLNIVTSKQGSLRGGHYHRKTREFFYVLHGEVKTKICTSDGKVHSYTFHSGDCFEVLEAEQHYLKFLKDTTLVVLYSAPFNNSNPDVFVEIALPKLEEIFVNE